MKKSFYFILACSLGIILFLVSACSEQKAPSQTDEPQSEDQKIKVIIPLNAPDFTDECTNLPVRVVGNDAAGKQTDEICYVAPDGRGIDLLPGDYSFAIAASPLVPQGRLFDIPEGGIGVTLESANDESGAYRIQEDFAWSLSLADPDLVTQEEIQEAYEYALKSPGQEERAKMLYEEYGKE